jgi:hypothetical protein
MIFFSPYDNLAAHISVLDQEPLTFFQPKDLQRGQKMLAQQKDVTLFTQLVLHMT